MQHEGDSTATLSRRNIFGFAGLGGAMLVLAACGPTAATASGAGAAGGAPSSSEAAAGTPAAPAAAAPGAAWLYLSIAVVKKDGNDWPELVPSNFTVPANSTVHVEIRDFDNGAATIPAGYEQVKGTADGAMTLIPSVEGDLSGAQPQTVQTVDPKNVTHTLTVADTGLNIPIPPLSTVLFTFKTGAAGTHTWQCMAACGTGTSGWEGPMADAGFMHGKMTVQA